MTTSSKESSNAASAARGFVLLAGIFAQSASSYSSSHDLEQVGEGASALTSCGTLTVLETQIWGVQPYQPPGYPDDLGSILLPQSSTTATGSWAGFANLYLTYQPSNTVCTYTAHNGFPGEVPVFTFGG